GRRGAGVITRRGQETGHGGQVIGSADAAARGQPSVPRFLSPVPFEALRHRIVWLFALGLVVFYTPYAGLAKAVTAGLLPGIPKGLVGFEILPAAILGTVLTIPLIITLLGWWRYALPV